MADVPRSAEYLVDLVLNTPGVLDQVKAHPEETLRGLAAQTTKHLPTPAVVSKPGLYYAVIWFLGLVSLTAIVGAIYLAANTQPGQTIVIPDLITALGSAAIGALAGLLAPLSNR